MLRIGDVLFEDKKNQLEGRARIREDRPAKDTSKRVIAFDDRPHCTGAGFGQPRTRSYGFRRNGL